MKRVILFLIFALFIVGMAVPSATFAGNSNKTAAFDRNLVRGTCPHVPDIDQASADVDICRAQDMKRTWGESLRHLFGRYFISRLPGTGIIAIGISGTDDDGPLESQYPPGWNGEPSDRRPDTDEDGWVETK